MKKVLVVLTSVSKYATTERATGLWFGESVHFANVMGKAGYQIDYASPLGGYTPIDPHSIQKETMTELDWNWYTNKEKMNLFANTLKIADVNANDYGVIYFAGGHGVVWDFLNDTAMQKLAETIYANGGIVSSVCHGAVALINLKDPTTGEWLVKGKKVTGFSNSEEKEAQLDHLVPFLTETELVNHGAKYVKAENWKEFAVTDGRLVTGQNPASGAAVARQVLAVLEK